jgi:hypothetical protein
MELGEALVGFKNQFNRLSGGGLEASVPMLGKPERLSISGWVGSSSDLVTYDRAINIDFDGKGRLNKDDHLESKFGKHDAFSGVFATDAQRVALLCGELAKLLGMNIKVSTGTVEEIGGKEYAKDFSVKLSTPVIGRYDHRNGKLTAADLSKNLANSKDRIAEIVKEIGGLKAQALNSVNDYDCKGFLQTQEEVEVAIDSKVQHNRALASLGGGLLGEEREGYSDSYSDRVFHIDEKFFSDEAKVNPEKLQAELAIKRTQVETALGEFGIKAEQIIFSKRYWDPRDGDNLVPFGAKDALTPNHKGDEYKGAYLELKLDQENIRLLGELSGEARANIAGKLKNFPPVRAESAAVQLA